MALSSLAASLVFACAAAQTTVELSIGLKTPVKSNVSSTWLSANFDAASLFHALDFTDPYLRTIVKQLGATHLRIGGTAQNSLYYIPHGPFANDGHGATVINDVYWKQLSDFQVATGVEIQFGLMRQTTTGNTNTGIFDPTINTTALFNATQAAGYNITGWSLGNELVGTGFNMSQYAVDYASLRSVLTGHPIVGQTLSGPSVAGFPGADLVGPFMQQTYLERTVDIFTFHAYSFKNCSLDVYANLGGIEHIGYYFESFTGVRDSVAPGQKLIVEECATQAGGGCANLSSSFVSSFWYMRTLQLASFYGLDGVQRQDIVGWSFDSKPSQYSLAGVPGWTSRNASGGSVPTPHPDYYLHILWKQLSGSTILNSTISASSDPAVATYFASGAWCASATAVQQLGLPAGSAAVVISWLNLGTAPVTVDWSQGGTGGLQMTPRLEFTLAGTNTTATTTSSSSKSTDPPPYLLSNAVYLNGAAQPLSVDPASGLLPQYPIQGQLVSATASSVDATPFVAQPYTLGFVVVPVASGTASPCAQ